MLGLKEFAVPFGVLCLAIWVWLFWSRPVLLIGFFIATMAIVVLFYRKRGCHRVGFRAAARSGSNEND
jgi:hypothetical protein